MRLRRTRIRSKRVVLALLIPGFLLSACGTRQSGVSVTQVKRRGAGGEGISVSGFTSPLLDLVGVDGSPDDSREPLSDIYSAAQADHIERMTASAAVPVGADGFYDYLVNAGYSLSASTVNEGSEGARRSISFVIADRGHGHRLRVYEFASHSEAEGLHSQLNTHKLAAVVGNLVLTADFPLPDGQTVGAIENALDIYVAKAQNGLLTEVASADTGRQPVKAIRKMFMLSRDAVVYANPTTESTPIATVREDSYVHVIDLLPNFLKVRLLSGEIGFVPERAVE